MISFLCLKQHISIVAVVADAQLFQTLLNV